MKPLGMQQDHYWLALSMAKAAGVDLQAAIDHGHYDHQEWAETVRDCRGCAWAGECKRWLHNHPEIDVAPETCVNAGVFARLKSLQTDAVSV